jgi:hypothetical protein
MMLVAEGDRLFFDDLNIGDVMPTVHRVGKCEEHTRSETGAYDAESGN